MTIHIPDNFYKETIAQDWPTGTGNFYVSAKPVKTAGYLTISPANSSLREIVFFSAIGTDGTGDYVTIADAGDRGLGGTTEQTHVIGEPVRMNITEQTIQEISDELDTKAPTISGIVPPSSTPAFLGQIYVDTVAKNSYMSVGTSSSADWKLIALI